MGTLRKKKITATAKLQQTEKDVKLTVFSNQLMRELQKFITIDDYLIAL